MFCFAVLLFGILAQGSQVVRSLDFKFSLSEVKQCEPVSLSFVGNSNARAIPMWLTLVPFNSNPVSIPVPNAAANISGVSVTFVPFEAGTNFVASLDNAGGENVARVSDVVRVLPSSSGNTTCIPETQDPAPPALFTLDNSTFLQCEPFTLKYNRSVVSQAPSVRLYDPKGPSLLLNLTMDNRDAGTASYMLSFERGKEVVLVMSDGTGHQESTALMTVGGDSSSSMDCLTIKEEEKEDTNMVKATAGVSQAVIIGCSVGGGIIALFAIGIIFFILREKRRRRPHHIEFDPALLEKARSPTPMSIAHSPSPVSPFEEKDLSPGYVKDPLYTTAKFLSPTTAHYPRGSIASWSQPIPNDQLSPKNSQRSSYVSSTTSGHLSIHALDIEGMLNMASVQSNRSSQLTADPAPLPQVTRPSETTTYGPHLTVPGSLPSRGHLRDPSDIPVGALSVSTDSTLSSVVDPFADDVTKDADKPLATAVQQTASDSIAKPPKVTLPSSPRDGLARVVRDRSSDASDMWQNMASPSSNRSSRGSTGDYYGVAR